MSPEKDRPLSTADLAAAAERQRTEERTMPDTSSSSQRPEHPGMRHDRPAPAQAVPARAEAPTHSEHAAMRETVDQDRHAAQAAAAARADEEKLEALFAPEAAHGFRSRWDEVQIGFVDDPKRAVRQADELVAQVMKSLAETFANERSRLEAHLGETDRGSTENLRVALRRYRSFFQRLLSL